MKEVFVVFEAYSIVRIYEDEQMARDEVKRLQLKNDLTYYFMERNVFVPKSE